MARDAVPKAGFAMRVVANAKDLRVAVFVRLVRISADQHGRRAANRKMVLPKPKPAFALPPSNCCVQIGLAGVCVQPGVKEDDHDDDYADALLETRNLLQFRDVQLAKQQFDNKRASGHISSFKSWMKESYNKARGERSSSSSSFEFSDSAQSDSDGRMSDSSGTTTLSSGSSTKSDSGMKAGAVSNSSAVSRGQSVSRFLGKLNLVGVSKATEMNVLSPRSVHSMATTDVDDEEHVAQKCTAIDVDAKMQVFFDSYAAHALDAANVSGW